MPDPAFLTPLGLAMLGSLPPKVRGSIDYMAVIHAQAREVALLEASIETVRAQFNPATADVLLDAWEAMLKLPVGGAAGASIADRRNLVLNRLRKLVTTGEGSQWEAAITDIVGPGWSYVEHAVDLGPLQNQALNPNFEHDAVGVSPAGYTGWNGLATHLVSSSWADLGTQSLHLVTDPAIGASGSAGVQVMGPVTGPGSAGAGVYAVTGGKPVAMRRRSHINSLAVGGQWSLNWGVFWYDSAGVSLGGASTTAVPVAAAQVGSTLDVTALLTAPADAAYGEILIQLSCVAAGQLDMSVDSVASFINPTSGTIPPYNDGDQPGWGWAGTPGDSVSQPNNPPNGEITVTLPYPPGATQFIDASNQIRDITDAHLVINFASSAVFRLDTDPMDSTEFGA